MARNRILHWHEVSPLHGYGAAHSSIHRCVHCSIFICVVLCSLYLILILSATTFFCFNYNKLQGGSDFVAHHMHMFHIFSNSFFAIYTHWWHRVICVWIVISGLWKENRMTDCGPILTDIPLGMNVEDASDPYYWTLEWFLARDSI